MKKIIPFFLLVCILGGCKVARLVPDNYNDIEENFIDGNYAEVIKLLNNPEIKHREKTDWYYFFYGVSLYKMHQWLSHEALRYVKIANAYNDEDFNITYYLGEISFDVGKYKQASKSFEKCITQNLGKSKDMNSHPALWLLLSKLKMNALNLDEFVELYGTNESEELKYFASILEERALRVDDVLYFIQSNRLSDREKLLVIDALLGIEQNRKQILETLYSLDLQKPFKEYFGARLIYYKLGTPDECFDLIMELNSSGDASYVILDTTESMVLEYFAKYRVFYYWLVKDYDRVAISINTYLNAKERVVHHSYKASEDYLKLFYKEFKNDSEFAEIKELEGMTPRRIHPIKPARAHLKILRRD